MKYLIVLVIAFMISGCASVSEYNQGCRDGVEGIGLEKATKDGINGYCNELDALHRQKERMRQGLK